MLFAGYPILDYYTKETLSNFGAFNVGGVNSTGQVPDIPGLPTLIDKDTPAAALTRTGFDGRKYVLMFSDEFETPGRTFWPGDDPWVLSPFGATSESADEKRNRFWEAVDLHYWATGDFEWYDPDAVTTRDGSLVITASEEPTHGLNFRSGMLQSWNKFWCVLAASSSSSARLTFAFAASLVGTSKSLSSCLVLQILACVQLSPPRQLWLIHGACRDCGLERGAFAFLAFAGSF